MHQATYIKLYHKIVRLNILDPLYGFYNWEIEEHGNNSLILIKTTIKIDNDKFHI